MGSTRDESTDAPVTRSEDIGLGEMGRCCAADVVLVVLGSPPVRLSKWRMVTQLPMSARRECVFGRRLFPPIDDGEE